MDYACKYCGQYHWDRLCPRIKELRADGSVVFHEWPQTYGCKCAEKDAEIERLRKECGEWTAWKALRERRGEARPGYGCCCEFDDNDEQTRWCLPHSEMRDEIERLRDQVYRLEQSRDNLLGEHGQQQTEIERLRGEIELLTNNKWSKIELALGEYEGKRLYSRLFCDECDRLRGIIERALAGLNAEFPQLSYVGKNVTIQDVRDILSEASLDAPQ